LSAICRLISRVVPLSAILNAAGLIRRILKLRDLRQPIVLILIRCTDGAARAVIPGLITAETAMKDTIVNALEDRGDMLDISFRIFTVLPRVGYPITRERHKRISDIGASPFREWPF
jgi:hypothetical protein